MKVFMIGGTGLLGCEAANILIKQGHQVTSVALPPLPEGAPIPKEMKLEFCDINKKSDAEVEKMMEGCDSFVFAAGIDERKECNPPVYDQYKKFNIDPIARLLPIAKKAGCKNAVVLGSYYTYMYKQCELVPENEKLEWFKGAKGLTNLLERNPYFKARYEQEQVAESFADDNFNVTVLELPYIFGTQPGRRPVWTILIDQLKRMDSLPFTLYPAGGTAMLTCRQVGQVIAGAATLDGKYGFRALPIGVYNMTWKEFLKIVYNARAEVEENPKLKRKFTDRKIVSVAPWMMKMGMGSVKKDYAARNIESGMDPDQLPYSMDLNLFIDSKYAQELGATEDDIKAAIEDSIRISVASVAGKVKLLDMAGEIEEKKK